MLLLASETTRKNKLKIKIFIAMFILIGGGFMMYYFWKTRKSVEVSPTLSPPTLSATLPPPTLPPTQNTSTRTKLPNLYD